MSHERYATLVLTLVLLALLFVPIVHAGPPIPSVVERYVQGAWEVVRVFCAEWGCWGLYLQQGYELESAVANGTGVRTALPSELARYPWARYVAVLSRPLNGVGGMVLVVPSAPLRALVQPSSRCAECARLVAERDRAPWWRKWWYTNRMEVLHCYACS